MYYVFMLTNYRLIRLQEETLLKFEKISELQILYILSILNFLKNSSVRKIL